MSYYESLNNLLSKYNLTFKHLKLVLELVNF